LEFNWYSTHPNFSNFFRPNYELATNKIIPEKSKYCNAVVDYSKQLMFYNIKLWFIKSFEKNGHVMSWLTVISTGGLRLSHAIKELW
jgi:hypothetical protein